MTAILQTTFSMDQCWLIISKVQWHSSECNSTRETSVTSHWNYLENYLSKILFQSPRGQWVNILTWMQFLQASMDIHLTHWGRMTYMRQQDKPSMVHIMVWHQAIIWTNAGILLIRPLGTNFKEFQSQFIHFHSRKCIWKCCLGNYGHFVFA